MSMFMAMKLQTFTCVHTSTYASTHEGKRCMQGYNMREGCWITHSVMINASLEPVNGHLYRRLSTSHISLSQHKGEKAVGYSSCM